MRISDWSSDVCSSDLLPKGLQSAGWVAQRTASANLLIGDAPLPFAAVISASATLDHGDGPLRATLFFAGQTLVEYQARKAAPAGAARSSIHMKHITPPLSRTVHALNTDGPSVSRARQSGRTE